MQSPFGGLNLPMPDFFDLNRMQAEDHVPVEYRQKLSWYRGHIESTLQEMSARGPAQAVAMLGQPVALLLVRVEQLTDDLQRLKDRVAKLEFAAETAD